jgi:hypothetical protein
MIYHGVPQPTTGVPNKRFTLREKCKIPDFSTKKGFLASKFAIELKKRSRGN